MIDYVIDEPNRLIRVWMSGSNRCEDLKAHYARVLRDPHYDPSLDCLFEIDRETDGPIVTELPEVKTVVEMLAQCQGTTKWAVVLEAGFKRTIVDYLFRDINLRSVSMRFFETTREAIAWINEDRRFPVTERTSDAARTAMWNPADGVEASETGHR